MNLGNTKYLTGIACLVFSSLVASQANAGGSDCTVDNISGEISFNFIQETLKSGDLNLNPTNELATKIQCGNHWSINSSLDFNSAEAFQFNGGRMESLNLTYQSDNNWGITAGLLGELRLPEVFMGAPGGRPDIAARQSLYAERIDNNHLVGVVVQKEFNLQNNWSFNLDVSTFRATTPKRNISKHEDRGNTKDFSYTLKGSFERKSNGGSISFGAETGRIQHGYLGTANENYVGVFGRFNTHLTDNLLWTNSVEQLYFENYFNEMGKDRRLTVAFSDLQWKPNLNNRLTLWGQVGFNNDNIKNDAAFVEFGSRYDLIRSERGELSFIAALDLEKNIDTRKLDWGSQIGLKANIRF
jgi:hypothetical protein